MRYDSKTEVGANESNFCMVVSVTSEYQLATRARFSFYLVLRLLDDVNALVLSLLFSQ